MLRLIEPRGYFEYIVSVVPLRVVVPVMVKRVSVVLLVDGQLLVAQLGDLQPRVLVVERGQVQPEINVF